MMRSDTRNDNGHRTRRIAERLAAFGSDFGQTALVPVLAVTLIISVIGATFVATIVQSVPLQANTSAAVYAHRALEAGENAYVTAINANPSLAQCSTGDQRKRDLQRHQLRTVEPGVRFGTLRWKQQRQ